MKIPPSLTRLLPAALVLAVFCGCGTHPAPRTGADIPGYREMIEDVKDVDARCLRGRLIMLDPGHGGFFRGAVGPNGLDEADVNLGVALYLRGLLEWAGARVVMTRTADQDFLAGTDSTLAADLAFRVSLMDSLQPDVFLSLHHNSNPAYDPIVNETQTYYPLGDPGPSRQLARAIHRHLALNLQITPARILPGNFHVLRNATVPAVLGEPAMLSNPVMAGRLSLAASQRLEAEAYFLGLVDYFRQGAPGWAKTCGDTVAWPADAAEMAMSWVFTPDRRLAPGDTASAAVPGPDPLSFTLRFNGEPQPIQIASDGRTVIWSPPFRGAYGLVEIQGRNLAGHATPVDRTWILPRRPVPPTIHLVCESGPDPALLVTWSHPGHTAAGGELLAPGGRVIPLGEAPEGGRQLLVNVQMANALPDPGTGWRWRAPTGEILPVQPTDCDTLQEPWRIARLEGLPIAAPQRMTKPRYLDLATRTAAPPLPWPFVAIPRSGGSMEIPGVRPIVLPEDPAILPVNSSGERVLAAQAIAPGAWGRTVLLDPRGGGIEDDGTGPLGTRGADLNLEVARLTAEILQGAGVRALVTRAAGRTPADPDKVLQARREHADLFLAIGRAAARDSVQVRHYPGSRTGAAWARAAAEALTAARVAADSCRTGPGADYLLRHTHCPALVAELPPPATHADELRETDPYRQRCEAYALALGVLAVLDPSGTAFPRVDLERILDACGLPVAQPTPDPLIWDGNFTVQLPGPAGPPAADAVSSYRMLLPAAGDHHLLAAVRPGQKRTTTWHLERTGETWNARSPGSAR